MFLLAILLHPDVLRKAQREIDEVIGKNRVPSFDDRSRLPYGTSSNKLLAISGRSLMPIGLES